MSLRDLIIIRPATQMRTKRLLAQLDRLIVRHSTPRRIRGEFSWDAGFDAGYVAAMKAAKSMMVDNSALMDGGTV